jgi:hypothetical protein
MDWFSTQFAFTCYFYRKWILLRLDVERSFSVEKREIVFLGAGEMFIILLTFVEDWQMFLLSSRWVCWRNGAGIEECGIMND